MTDQDPPLIPSKKPPVKKARLLLDHGVDKVIEIGAADFDTVLGPCRHIMFRHGEKSTITLSATHGDDAKRDAFMSTWFAALLRHDVQVAVLDFVEKRIALNAASRNSTHGAALDNAIADERASQDTLLKVAPELTMGGPPAELQNGIRA